MATQVRSGGRPLVGPTARVTAACLFILGVVLLYPGTPELLIGWTLLLLLLGAVCAVRWRGVLRRAAPAAPFVALIAIFLPFTRPGVMLGQWDLGFASIAWTDAGVHACHLVLARSTLAVLAVSVVAESSSASEIGRALQDLRMPALVLTVLMLAMRYLTLLQQEGAALWRARELRRGERRRRGEWHGLGDLVGTLFVRSFERAERVHAAMRLRGFDGEFRLLQSGTLGAADSLFLMGMTLALIGLGVLSQ